MTASKNSPDSSCATGFRDALALASGLPARTAQDVAAVVVHTTGVGVVARWEREGAKFSEATSFETAIRIYTKIMRFCPHYVVGQGGECVQVVPESRAAEHTGSSHRLEYARPDWAGKGCDWWTRRWDPLKAPSELAGGKLWRHGSPNHNSIGIEVVPGTEDPRGAWSVAAIAKLRALCEDICTRYSIPLDRFHVVSHSDANPLARTAHNAPWDPSPAQWQPELVTQKAMHP